MKRRRRKSTQNKLHIEGPTPWLAAVIGMAGAVFIMVIVLWPLFLWDHAAVELEWAAPLLVSVVVAGGVAGLAIKNLNLKRAESRRARNRLFDGQFETGAKLLGGDTELEIIAGSLLLSSLLRDSETHAQSCADLLCAALRKRRRSDLTPEEESDLFPDPPIEFVEDLATTLRVRNALVRAIAQAIKIEYAPKHLEKVRWDFIDLRFGDETAFRGCLFGAGTTLSTVTARGPIDFSHSSFASSVRFQRVRTRGGLKMRRVQAAGVIEFIDCDIRSAIGNDFSWIDLEGADIQGLEIENVRSAGPLHLDVARIDGDVDVQNSRFLHLSFIEGRCNRYVSLHDVSVEEFICIRKTPVRKGVDLSGCEVGTEIEVTGVSTLGVISVKECTYTELKLDETRHFGEHPAMEASTDADPV